MSIAPSLLAFKESDGWGWKPAFLALALFSAIWAPYRLLSGAIASRFSYHALMYVDMVVKPSVTLAVIALSARVFKLGSIRGVLAKIGLKLKAIPPGVAIGTLAHLLYNATAIALKLAADWSGDVRIELSISHYSVLNMAYMLAVVGVFEELLDRGFIQTNIAVSARRKAGILGLILSIVATGFFFSLLHIPIDVFVRKLPPYAIATHLGYTFSFSLAAGSLYFATDLNIIACAVMHGLENTGYPLRVYTGGRIVDPTLLEFSASSIICLIMMLTAASLYSRRCSMQPPS